MTQETASEHRAVCHTCFRPLGLCYCALLSRVENRTPLLIVQHPHERFHPFGTARIAERCLKNVRIEVDYNRTLRDGERQIDFPEGAGLLYPGPDAQDLGAISQAEHPKALVVLDGTWHQARTLYRDIPALKALPKFGFNPEQPSQYRIRKEPSLECVSTIEAIVHALRLLEPDTPGLGKMLTAFSGMIDLQINAAKTHERKPRFPQRQRPRDHGLPPYLTEDFDRVVIIYGEASFTGNDSETMSSNVFRKQPKELIHWVARRLRDNQHFGSIIRPTALPNERRLCPTGLTGDDLQQGISLEQAREKWAEFTEADDLLVSWNKSTLDIMRPIEGAHAADYLKGTYKNFARRRDRKCAIDGSIDLVIERESLSVGPHIAKGRAGLRLAQLEAMIRFIHENTESSGQRVEDRDLDGTESRA